MADLKAVRAALSKVDVEHFNLDDRGRLIIAHPEVTKAVGEMSTEALRPGIGPDVGQAAWNVICTRGLPQDALRELSRQQDIR